MQNRLKLYLSTKSLTYKDFENLCSLSNGTAARLRPTTRKSTLDRIANSCDLNINWLLTGEGKMINDKTNNTSAVLQKDNEFKTYFKETHQVMVPLINIDSVGGIHSQNLLTAGEQYVEELVPFPNARPDDVAILQSGNSMSPVIPPGAVLQIRRVDDWRNYFGYGNVFVLWLTDDRRITKLVKRYDPDPKNYIMCCSYNSDADDEELPKSKIREVWKVVNVLIREGW